jgi:hypothetical protein
VDRDLSAGAPAEPLAPRVQTVLVAAVFVLCGGFALADPLTERIQDSALAAQALQGQFDGGWTLHDRAGRVLFVFQMSDPPGSTGPAQGAWRDAAGGMGRVDFIAEGPRRLRIAIDGAPPFTFERRAGLWRGVLAGHGAVTLTRGLATPPPPV